MLLSAVKQGVYCLYLVRTYVVRKVHTRGTTQVLTELPSEGDVYTLSVKLCRRSAKTFNCLITLCLKY